MTKGEATHMSEDQEPQLAFEHDDVHEREVLHANGASQVQGKEQERCCLS